MGRPYDNPNSNFRLAPLVTKVGFEVLFWGDYNDEVNEDCLKQLPFCFDSEILRKQNLYEENTLEP